MVVVLMGAAALLALKAFNTLKALEDGGAALEQALFTVQQQAGIIAALSTAVFSVITALKTGRPGPVGYGAAPVVPGMTTPSGVPTQFGTVATK